MILICPNCTTRFLLSAFVLGEEGRKVKCSNCAEIWFQLPDLDELHQPEQTKPEPIPESVRPVPQGSSLPVPKDERDEANDQRGGNVAGAVLAALLFVAVSAGLIFSNKQIAMLWPQSHVAYKLVGITTPLPGVGLVFDRLEAQALEDGSLFLSGVILNLTHQGTKVPMMEAVLRDARGEDLSRMFIEAPADYIEAEGALPFEAKLEDDEAAREIFLRLTSGNATAVAPLKTDGEGGENIPAPHADGTSPQNGHAESGESLPHVSAPPHRESSH